MKTTAKLSLALLRISLGWLFFYAGITKVMDPDWTSAGFLQNAGFLADFYSWLALPSNLPWVDFLNQWGLTVIGVSLILGLLVRYSSFFGIVMMILYYIPELSTFPMIGDHSYIVDEHIIYIFAFGVLMANCAGNYFGIDKYLPTCHGNQEDYGEEVSKINY